MMKPTVLLAAARRNWRRRRCVRRPELATRPVQTALPRSRGQYRRDAAMRRRTMIVVEITGKPAWACDLGAV